MHGGNNKQVARVGLTFLLLQKQILYLRWFKIKFNGKWGTYLAFFLTFQCHPLTYLKLTTSSYAITYLAKLDKNESFTYLLKCELWVRDFSSAYYLSVGNLVFCNKKLYGGRRKIHHLCVLQVSFSVFAICKF